METRDSTSAHRCRARHAEAGCGGLGTLASRRCLDGYAGVGLRHRGSRLERERRRTTLCKMRSANPHEVLPRSEYLPEMRRTVVTGTRGALGPEQAATSNANFKAGGLADTPFPWMLQPLAGGTMRGVAGQVRP